MVSKRTATPGGRPKGSTKPLAADLRRYQFALMQAQLDRGRRFGWSERNVALAFAAALYARPGETPDDDSFVTGIHRTALTSNGRGRRRLMLGAIAGSAIFLDDPALALERSEVVLCKGVETALAMRALGYSSALAFGSTSGFRNFLDLTPAVTLIRMSADNDEASRRAVNALSQRARAAGQRVIIMRPRFGKDANDLLMEAAHASA
jgi:hypothetical protein